MSEQSTSQIGMTCRKMNLVKAWITIHEEELMADWELALNGEPPYKIAPLQ